MQLKTTLEKLGYDVSLSKEHTLYSDFETYLFEDFRLACIVELNYECIRLLEFKKTTEWKTIYEKHFTNI